MALLSAAWSQLSRMAKGLLAVVVAGGLLVLAPTAASAQPQLVWQRSLPGAVVWSSPAPVTLADGSPGITFGSHDGKLYVVKASDGSDAPGWPQQTTNAIDSSPAVANIGPGGSEEIVVGDGNAAVQSGGLYGYGIAGNLLFHDVSSDAAGPNIAIQASPTIGDVNRNGVPAITVGNLGQSVLSVAPNGAENPGYPYLALDSVFSSAALADVNGDGQTDIVEGGDSYPGTPGHPQGGLVRALTGNGQTLWEYRIDEQVESSPSVGDINGDTIPDIVFGAGDYWRQHGGALDSDNLYALNMNGTLKLGWPKVLDNYTMASPTLADINGDGRLDVVEGTWNPNGSSGSVWAFDGFTGAELWPHHNVGNGTIIGQIVTADFNGDGAQDLLVPTSNGAYALDGKTGNQLFSVEAGLSMQDSPLVWDFTGNGTISIIVAGEGPNHTGVVARYDVPLSDHASMGNLGWPMFRKDARRTGSWTNPPLVQSFCTKPGGYWLAATDGGIFTYCDAGFYGSAGGIHLNSRIVGMASTPDGKGYWLVAADGGIFNYGDAGFFGSAGSIHLNSPIVGMASTADGKGYWLVAADGGIFNYGDAGFFGSAGSIHLNSPIVGLTPAAGGFGYWLVASDGGIFNYGAAGFYGSAGAVHLNKPIVGMAAAPGGTGYWLVATDGGIFNYGTAGFAGSAGGIHLNQPIVGMAPAPDGSGYWLVASDGGIFNYGSAALFGSAGSIHLNQPIVGMAAAP